MTRLKNSDINKLAEQLGSYDASLREKTGHTLCEIACRAIGVDKSRFEDRAKSTGVWVVPLDVGQGLIEDFSGTVQQIAAYMGCQAFTSGNTGVAGIAEAYEQRADIVMMADDDTFVALNVHTQCIADNAEMTARGFVTGAELMAGGLPGVPVLIIGCGLVGGSAASVFLESGARVSLFDINNDRSRALEARLAGRYGKRIVVENQAPSDYSGYTILFDASPAENVILESQIGSTTYVSAPGVPLGVDVGARQKLGKRLLHDPLQIGVATMVVKAVMG